MHGILQSEQKTYGTLRNTFEASDGLTCDCICIIAWHHRKKEQ